MAVVKFFYLSFIAVLYIFALSQSPSVSAQPSLEPLAEPSILEPLINCSLPNAQILWPANCTGTPVPLGTAFTPVSTTTSIIFGVSYAALNLLLIAGVIILVKFFKRKAQKPPKAKAGK